MRDSDDVATAELDIVSLDHGKAVGVRTLAQSAALAVVPPDAADGSAGNAAEFMIDVFVNPESSPRPPGPRRKSSQSS